MKNDAKTFLLARWLARNRRMTTIQALCGAITARRSTLDPDGIPSSGLGHIPNLDRGSPSSDGSPAVPFVGRSNG